MSLSSFAAAQILRALPRVHISRAVGRLCDQPIPSGLARAVERAYCRAYQVNMDEAEGHLGSYPSFDAFFTRSLKKGTRRISADPAVSPADGKLSCLGRIDTPSRILVKGQEYMVGELIGDDADAERYSGGQFAVVYLAPGDYHRVHSPVDGRVTLLRGMPGDLFPVSSIGERYVPRLFVRNNRVAIVIDTETLGRVTVVMIGATIVGRISVTAMPGPAVPPGVHRIEPPLGVARGDEIGMFHLGSTAVVLFEPGLTLSRATGPVRLGQSLVSSS
ncbi:MAG TPA: archaetidylserine decarboxylase [Polyangiaceae bacterium]|nr:archaetidylserine decarboxylase [Polyangiaceae bacterium]